MPLLSIKHGQCAVPNVIADILNDNYESIGRVTIICVLSALDLVPTLLPASQPAPLELGNSLDTIG